jgi:hypothetical protein
MHRDPHKPTDHRRSLRDDEVEADGPADAGAA